ncbi:hypothetical protein P3X46_007471 [Hevea brasiliensis]|uniref:C2 domain-containing protein n=1 Tax=Hevea brasiliensis TaxID=3981 RepID=A0ABQ9MTR9_HEVBR|nr:hypothetical protein P3X46_007471 [Hevea brasiliensis]
MIMEINLISAQHLRSGRRSSAMQTYVMAYLNPKRKLTSRIDKDSKDSSTWNDKFMKNKRIVVVRVLLDSLISKDHGCSEGESPKFAAFHVRTPTSVPLGILNFPSFFLHISPLTIED